MSKRLPGSCDFTNLLNAAKAGHSAFSKSEKNGHIYFNFTAWLNDDPDQYRNDMSLKLNSTKEKAQEEKELFNKGYFGKAKMAKQDNATFTESDLNQIPDQDDLPF